MFTQKPSSYARPFWAPYDFVDKIWLSAKMKSTDLKSTTCKKNSLPTYITNHMAGDSNPYLKIKMKLLKYVMSQAILITWGSKELYYINLNFVTCIVYRYLTKFKFM